MTKLVVTLCIPGLPFNGETFHKQSLGGSESAGYYLARALAKLGHSVTIFCNTEKAVSCGDVDYLPLGMFRSYIEYTPHDVCIVQRAPDMLQGYNQAKLTILWCHDLAMKRAEGLYRGVAWNYDKVAVLSGFMRDQYKQVYGLADSQLFLTRNGVDLEAVSAARTEFESLKTTARNPLSLVFSARPERGLDVILSEVIPRILREEPNARLFLSSYHNPVDQLADFYAHCDTLARGLGNNVVQLGSLTKAQLYAVYHTAGVYAYPVPSRLVPEFDEVSCISIMEAQACGLPVVTSARGALPETLSPEAGRLIAEPVHTGAYADAFAEACLRYMLDPEARRRATAAGLARAATLGWDGVARQWSEMMEAEIRARSADLATLANHFWRRSDIYAAKECLARLPADDAASVPVRRRIEEDWVFLGQPDGMRTQYERIGATHDPRVIDWSPQEPRYRAVRQWLQARVAELPEGQMLSVLDYGCAHGGYATNLLKEIPRLRITGIDIDLRGIQLADQFAEKLGVSDRWRGVVGDLDRLSDPDVPEMREQYDIVMAQEVLEHVPDPGALVVALDARVRDGGRVWMTVPHGPWEYSDYRRYPHRAHVREFDLHDLHDLLDAKGRSSQLSISSMPFGHSPETDEALGWWVVQYEVHPDGRGKVGAIDMDRKLAIQRPRQTVSATIMAGGETAEETLHWCLKSLAHVADELIIADCGLSEESHRIIDQYRWVPLDGKPHAYLLDIRIIPGGDPKVDGFEAPRNKALSEARGDWVLWLDTDEKLLQPDKVAKYLRPNGFDGYSIKQHHFSVDANFGADLPVRLFRNPLKTGSGMRFIGMIHEHPEKGLNMGPGAVTVLPDVHIPHVGYLIESGRQKKFGRNLPMLEADMAKYPERLLQKHFIMRDKMLLVGNELRNNGSRVTPQIRKACDEVVELYRKHFLGKGHFTNVDPIEYYSQANAVLAQGFDSAFSINVDKVDAHLNGTTKARFASVDDFVAEITNRARDAAAPMATRYW